jgi:hypothetical protein
VAANPFDLDAHGAYAAWRDARLAAAPRDPGELLVEVQDPQAPTPAEREALVQRCRRANLALYAGPLTDPGSAGMRRIGAALGLVRPDHNRYADAADITALRVMAEGPQGRFIPYTDRPLHWHTDGYYNPRGAPVRGLLLHCVRPARAGGENRLLDPEIAYILLREADPDHVRALMRADAMAIPPHGGDGEPRRGESVGPVFSVMGGRLHMRYTARRRNIRWSQDPAVQAAKAALEGILEGSEYVLRARLLPGWGLVCNNVLHDRSGFEDDPQAPRLLYRARYYDRVAGT